MITNHFATSLEYRAISHNKKLREGDWLCVVRTRDGRAQVTAFWCRYLKDRDVSVSPHAIFIHSEGKGWFQPLHLNHGILTVDFQRDSVFRWWPHEKSPEVPLRHNEVLDMLVLRRQRKGQSASKG